MGRGRTTLRRTGFPLAGVVAGTVFCFLLGGGAARADAPIIDAMHAHDWPRAQALAAREPDAVAQKIVTYARMLTPEAASAAEIGAFIAANPDWPDQANLHKRLDDAIAGDADQASVLAACAQFAPALDRALLRCAAASRAVGREAAAIGFAQKAWVQGVRDPDAEAEFLGQWGAAATADIQWQRFDVLDWARDPAAARQIGRLDAGHRAEAAARQAFQTRDARALDFLPSVPAALRSDPALIWEQAKWLRLTEADAAAVALWRAAGQAAEAAAPTARRAAFWSERDRLARAVLAQGDAANAYFLADDAAVGPDQAPDALFLAGWVALRRLHDPARALAKFTALQGISHSLITQSRAWYWIGRGSAGAAQAQAYGQAAAYPTTYYGQKALAALGRPAGPAIEQASDPAVTPAQASQFGGQELVRAARILAGWDDSRWGRQFLLRQAQLARDAAAFAQVARTALSLGMPDVAVATARLAGRQGIALPRVGWPAPFEPPAGEQRALVLGLMRQESSFDAGVVSGAGAVGLMQLMPGTARQMAGGGAPALKDPDVNMRLGILYFGQLLSSFGGVRPYAIAAYNAGPRRAREWIAVNGDAAAAGDEAMIDWIEQIPFPETRNYVQRVLENAQVYQARLGG